MQSNYESKKWIERELAELEARVQIPARAMKNLDCEVECKNPEQLGSIKRFGFKCKDKSEYGKLKRVIQISLPELSYHEVRDLKSVLHQYFLKKYAKNRPPKYGSLNKGFTESELQIFFRAIDDEKFRLLFSYQAILGLRVGEAVKVNVKDINFETRELVLKTEKARVIDTLLIPVPLFRQTLEYIRVYGVNIEQAQGYLFFKAATKFSNRIEPYLSQFYVKNAFREFILRAGLDQVYDVSDESIFDRRPRKLHRLTSHSLRHFAITSFSKQTNGNVVLTSKFARHADTSTTMTYINTTKQELYKEIDNAFSTSSAIALQNKLSKRKSLPCPPNY